MASFIELNEVWFGDEIRPCLLNVDQIVAVTPVNSHSYKGIPICAQVELATVDGENNPMVFRVTETYEEVKQKCTVKKG